MGFGLDLQVSLLDVGGRRIVASVEPHQKAGMVTQTKHLRAERCRSDGQVLRRPILPLFPVIAAAPAEHHEDAAFVGKTEELVGLEFALEPDGVEVHVLHEFELVAKALIIGAQQHILRPACAANQNRFAIDAEEAAAVGGQLRRDFANAVVHALLIGCLAFSVETDGQVLEVRFAHLARPPRLWILYAKGRELLRAEDYGLIFVGR